MFCKCIFEFKYLSNEIFDFKFVLLLFLHHVFYIENSYNFIFSTSFISWNIASPILLNDFVLPALG